MPYRNVLQTAALLAGILAFSGPGARGELPPPGPGFEPFSFVNFESPHVHPLELTPSGERLLAVQTASHRLQVFRLVPGAGPRVTSVPVGLDPVSVRALDDRTAWVVNQVSDSVSVVDLDLGVVVATLETGNEPADVVFAGDPLRAFVSASEANRIEVFDPSDLGAAPTLLPLAFEEPRALAVSLDGGTVYAASFESGNGTTTVAGGKNNDDRVLDAVRAPEGPYGGVDVPPNRGELIDPPIAPGLPDPPPVSVIVKKNTSGQWLDENAGDWTELVSGDLAALSNRVVGWDLPDRDLAEIDAENLSVTYRPGPLNLQMAIAVEPATGAVSVVGTQALNEVRYISNLNGVFLRVELAQFEPAGTFEATDLNPHLDYQAPSVPQSERERSLGDPRGIAWAADSARAWITGMGSNNVVVVDAEGDRIARIEVGEGPTGIVLHESLGLALVLNRFDSSISAIDLETFEETRRFPFFDPTPESIRDGRPFLYDTHTSSGLGHISCASCHVDGRTDRLAWDLGDPEGELTLLGEVEVHPMKGPMKTQSLQDLIGVPALHHRGDRETLADFAASFETLQGADGPLDPASMALFEAYLDTLHLPPNPYRNLDNSLSTAVPIPGPDGTVRVVADAVSGLEEHLTGAVSGSVCINCHVGQRSRSAQIKVGGMLVDQPAIPETLSGFYDRIGLWWESATGSTSGFGLRPDASQSSELRHLGNGFPLDTEAGVDVIAFNLSIEGPVEGVTGLSRDAHAGTGAQVTLSQDAPAAANERLAELVAIADTGNVGLVAHGRFEGARRGFLYAGAERFGTDAPGETVTLAELETAAAGDAMLTFTLVPRGSGYRLALDRDLDGIFDRTEALRGLDPERVDSTWTVCAQEGEVCEFTGRRPVRFGSTEQSLYALAEDGFLCDASLLGDPDPGAAKSCALGIDRAPSEE